MLIRHAMSCRKIIQSARPVDEGDHLKLPTDDVAKAMPGKLHQLDAVLDERLHLFLSGKKAAENIKDNERHGNDQLDEADELAHRPRKAADNRNISYVVERFLNPCKPALQRDIIERKRRKDSHTGRAIFTGCCLGQYGQGLASPADWPLQALSFAFLSQAKLFLAEAKASFERSLRATGAYPAAAV